MTDVRKDSLTEAGSLNNLLIVNFGDPAFRPRGPNSAIATNYFINIVAYLLFTDKIAVPTRFILDSAPMAQTAVWSEPLLRNGLVVPERRAGPGSFVDLAHERSLPEIALRRAEFLDDAAMTIRRFSFDKLGDEYVTLLTKDLGVGGAFRHVVPGGTKGRHVGTMDRALYNYTSNGDFNPESFASAIREADPHLGRLGLQWAMARYYTTPLSFDRSNTRQLPTPSAKLLIKGGLLDPAIIGLDVPAPVRLASDRLMTLHTQLAAEMVPAAPEAYCESLLTVREEVPEARSVFNGIRDDRLTMDAGRDLADRFDRELKRQLKVRTSPGQMFKWSSRLIAAGAGIGVSAVVGADAVAQGISAVGGAVGSGFAEDRIANRFYGRRQRRSTPWRLAIDRMVSEVGENR